MDFLMQRFWHTTVVRDDQHLLTASTSYMDAWVERRAVIQADINTLRIMEAWLERLGRPGDMSENHEHIDTLKGIEAYLGSGSDLRHALQGIKDVDERALFNDSVIGIVQAETFLYKERGYADADAYNNAWEEFYLDSCRYYSHLDRIKTTWGGYIGQATRSKNLFDRCKTQQLYKNDRGGYVINGSLIDSFHQVNSSLELDENMKVVAAFGQLLRCPDEVCRESAAQMENIIGRLMPTSKKQLAHLLGAGQGCVHLIDLAYDSIRTLELYRGETK
jgi:hypothetical protein